jgi:hypothetical protein
MPLQLLESLSLKRVEYEDACKFVLCFPLSALLYRITTFGCDGPICQCFGKITVSHFTLKIEIAPEWHMSTITKYHDTKMGT